MINCVKATCDEIRYLPRPCNNACERIVGIFVAMGIIFSSLYLATSDDQKIQIAGIVVLTVLVTATIMHIFYRMCGVPCNYRSI